MLSVGDTQNLKIVISEMIQLSTPHETVALNESEYCNLLEATVDECNANTIIALKKSLILLEELVELKAQLVDRSLIENHDNPRTSSDPFHKIRIAKRLWYIKLRNFWFKAVKCRNKLSRSIEKIRNYNTVNRSDIDRARYCMNNVLDFYNKLMGAAEKLIKPV